MLQMPVEQWISEVMIPKLKKRKSWTRFESETWSIPGTEAYCVGHEAEFRDPKWRDQLSQALSNEYRLELFTEVKWLPPSPQLETGWTLDVSPSSKFLEMIENER